MKLIVTVYIAAAATFVGAAAVAKWIDPIGGVGLGTLAGILVGWLQRQPGFAGPKDPPDQPPGPPAMGGA